MYLQYNRGPTTNAVYKSMIPNTIVSRFDCMSRFVPNSPMLLFKESKDNDGYLPNMSDDMYTDILYQVTLTTKPGLAQYEATVRRHIIQDTYEARPEEISRVNKYGTQPHCLMDEFPHLRKYCYCRVQKE